MDGPFVCPFDRGCFVATLPRCRVTHWPTLKTQENQGKLSIWGGVASSRNLRGLPRVLPQVSISGVAKDVGGGDAASPPPPPGGRAVRVAGIANVRGAREKPIAAIAFVSEGKSQTNPEYQIARSAARTPSVVPLPRPVARRHYQRTDSIRHIIAHSGDRVRVIDHRTGEYWEEHILA